MLERDYGTGDDRDDHASEEMLNLLHLARLWAARILDDMGRPSRRDVFDEDVLFELELADEETHRSEVDAVLHDRRRIHQRRMELEAMPCTTDGLLSRNLAFLAQRYRLDRADLAVVALAALGVRFEWLTTLLRDAARHTRFAGAAEGIAAATGVSVAAIRDALSYSHRLVRCGLLVDTPFGRSEATDPPLLDNRIRIGLWRPDFGEDFLQGQYLQPAPATAHDDLDLDTLPEAFRFVAELVGAMRDGRTPPGQILIHGTPGTGKTRFARGLARHLGMDCFEIIDSRPGDELRAEERLRCFANAHELMRQHNRTLLLFDECDEAISTDQGGHALGRLASSKSRIHAAVESDAVPGLWIANDIDRVHASTLRRFVMIAEMPALPDSTRTRILREALGDLPVDETWLTQVSRVQSITPALIQRAACIGKAVSTTVGGQASEPERVYSAMTLALREHCRAAGRRFDPPRTAAKSLDLPYSSRWLNTEPGLDALLDQLTASKAHDARLLLHGPPGTGKTRLAREIAERTERPLKVIGAADLLNAFVGETEKNIRDVFERASEEGQVLLLDEVDGLLRDRAQAHRNWEVTQVNELLMQIDAFDGLLLAATNRLETIDAAVLRRFDAKVKFDYMKPDHALEMLEAVLGDGPSIGASERQRLGQLDRLTPGDFRTALRQLRIRGAELEAGGLIEALEAEVRGKPGVVSKGIGFMASISGG